MVSPLWKACQDGDATRVHEILVEATNLDVEIKDHTGVTPLIQAIRGGHVEIVKALIAKGADPANASAQGRPETYTTDPLILHMLAAARGDLMAYPERLVEHPQFQPHPQQQFYGYPQYMYPQYPPQEGWYPPPQQQQGQQQQHQHQHQQQPQQPVPQEGDPVAANLPPPEVSRNIPCRYFPACRYGTACAFLHPQTPYFTGPLPPPAQYPAYYPHPPQHPPPPPAPVPPHFSPPAQGPPHVHAHSHSHSHSDIMPLSPPPPPPPPMMGYMPMSPTGYQGYPLPLPPPPPVGVDENGAPLSPYGNGAPAVGPGGYPAPYGPGNPYVNGVGHHGPGGGGRPRRGSVAFRDREGRMPNGNGNGNGHGGFGGKKPPCLFFPSGRCRNGDECRFPHVLNDANSPAPTHQGGRPQFPSRRGGFNGNGNGNGATGLEDRMAGLRVGVHGRNRSQPNVGQGQGQQPAHLHQHGQNQGQGAQQRIPSADEFPVLNGHTNASTSGSDNGTHGHGHPHENGNENGSASGHPNGHNHYQNGWANAMNGTGPTAAQILRDGSRGTSPVPKPVSKAHAPPSENKPAAASKVTDIVAGKVTSLTVKENLKPMEVKAAA